MSRSLGIVIPAYRPDIDALTEYIAAIRDEIDPEVIRVEADGLEAATRRRLDQTAAEVNVAASRRGKGSAITDGFEAIETDVVAFADADGSVPARSLAAVVRPVEAGRTDLGIGSRRHPEAEIVSHQTVVRRLLGDAFAGVARRLLPIQCYDYQCGAKAITAEAWGEIRHYCYEQGFAWDLELLSVADALGYGIAEIPVVWEDHPDSTVDPLPTAVELASALVGVRRRTDLIPPAQYRTPHAGPASQSAFQDSTLGGLTRDEPALQDPTVPDANDD